MSPEFEGQFFGEMRRVVDLIHGRADIEPRPGHASGHYTADVSDWTLAWIIGREWEPFSVVAFDSIHPDLRYREQRPAAYTNWPTLDPLDHPSESTVAEEVAIRTALGETVDVAPREYDNDAIGLDAALVRATDSYPAGYFASYHAYPYYPDFMIAEEAYRQASSSFGPSNYFGYLSELKAHHGDMAVLISEYGIPASVAMGTFGSSSAGWNPSSRLASPPRWWWRRTRTTTGCSPRISRRPGTRHHASGSA